MSESDLAELKAQWEKEAIDKALGGPRYYKKKPIVIEAIRYTADNRNDCLRWLGECARHTAIDEIIIKTLEGEMLAHVGDWIIKGIGGEFYPCRPGIFEATYKLWDETSQ